MILAVLIFQPNRTQLSRIGRLRIIVRPIGVQRSAGDEEILLNGMPRCSGSYLRCVKHEQARLGLVKIRRSGEAVDLRTLEAQARLFELEDGEFPLPVQQL